MSTALLPDTLSLSLFTETKCAKITTLNCFEQVFGSFVHRKGTWNIINTYIIIVKHFAENTSRVTILILTQLVIASSFLNRPDNVWFFQPTEVTGSRLRRNAHERPRGRISWFAYERPAFWLTVEAIARETILSPASLTRILVGTDHKFLRRLKKTRNGSAQTTI